LLCLNFGSIAVQLQQSRESTVVSFLVRSHYFLLLPLLFVTLSFVTLSFVTLPVVTLF
jgi:hypothetical protein